MDTGISGKVVIVTGATANIGRAIVLAFAAEGARVAISGRAWHNGKLCCSLRHFPGRTRSRQQRKPVSPGRRLRA